MEDRASRSKKNQTTTISCKAYPISQSSQKALRGEVNRCWEQINSEMLQNQSNWYFSQSKNGRKNADILVLSQDPREAIQTNSFVVKSLDLHRDSVTNHQIPPKIVHKTNGRVLRLHLELYQYPDILRKDEWAYDKVSKSYKPIKQISLWPSKTIWRNTYDLQTKGRDPSTTGEVTRLKEARWNINAYS
jgi:hypothetical protein